MATYPTRIDATWVHLRDRQPPLFQMPHMWQPNHHMPSPYHSSHCDRTQRGWHKWGAEYPDMYTHKSSSNDPTWFARTTRRIYDGDTKERMWPWELTSRPTEKRVYGYEREAPRPVKRSGFPHAVPHFIEGEIRAPRWGIYHPNHGESQRYHQHYYQFPSRAEPLPEAYANEKHL
ncbi:hypothetical protein NP493_41g02016 [Ridgeia piscesae]|uniref:Uncharacterized protein n=1 Tax=Ridgeia piscesae TaxID=27915 RepID=A0AAD9UJT8_RIDPI|nr:hypothetical protein NP493_41g02016 [Ridgeia piscesae]